MVPGKLSYTLVLIWVMIASIGCRGGEPGRRQTASAAHKNYLLRQLSRALVDYAKENSGRFPTRLDTAELSTYLSRYDPQVPTQIESGAYRYDGAGRNLTHERGAIIVYEVGGPHESIGANVMFSDGDVELLTPSEFQTIQEQSQKPAGVHGRGDS